MLEVAELHPEEFTDARGNKRMPFSSGAATDPANQVMASVWPATMVETLRIVREEFGGFESYLGRRQQLYRRDEAVMEKARVKEERLASSQKAQISIEDRHVARTLKKVEEAQKAHAVINVKVARRDHEITRDYPRLKGARA